MAGASVLDPIEKKRFVLWKNLESFSFGEISEPFRGVDFIGKNLSSYDRQYHFSTSAKFTMFEINNNAKSKLACVYSTFTN